MCPTPWRQCLHRAFWVDRRQVLLESSWGHGRDITCHSALTPVGWLLESLRLLLWPLRIVGEGRAGQGILLPPCLLGTDRVFTQLLFWGGNKETATSCIYWYWMVDYLIFVTTSSSKGLSVVCHTGWGLFLCLLLLCGGDGTKVICLLFRLHSCVMLFGLSVGHLHS